MRDDPENKTCVACSCPCDAHKEHSHHDADEKKVCLACSCPCDEHKEHSHE